MTFLAAAAPSVAQGLGKAFASPPSTAVSGAEPKDFKTQTFNIAPGGVNLGEILKNLQPGPPANGGPPFNSETLQTSSLKTGASVINFLQTPFVLLGGFALATVLIIRKTK